MVAKGGYYVFTDKPNGMTKVHGGPYKTMKEAMQAIFDGLKMVNVAAIDCEIEYWSAAEIERRKSVLVFPKEPV
jgi:hypothetical protein